MNRPLMLEGEKTSPDQTMGGLAPVNNLKKLKSSEAPKQAAREGHCEFFRRKIPLHALCGSMKANSVTKHPFRFLLPADLAGSQSLVNKSFGLQRTYKLRACVTVRGFLQKNLEYARSVHVVHQPPVAPLSGAQAVVSPEFRNIIGIPVGRFVITAAQEMPFFGRRGDELRVRVELENFTNRDADVLELQLYQHLRLQSDDGYDFEHECVVEEWYREGLGRNATERGDDARVLSLPLSQDIAPECIGLLVECSYYLKIRSRITWREGCAPEARVPISVQAPVETLQPALPAPSAPPVELLILEPHDLDDGEGHVRNLATAHQALMHAAH